MTDLFGTIGKATAVVEANTNDDVVGTQQQRKTPSITSTTTGGSLSRIDPSSSNNSSNNKNSTSTDQYFIDDDSETLSMLITQSQQQQIQCILTNDALTSFVQRFIDDHTIQHTTITSTSTAAIGGSLSLSSTSDGNESKMLWKSWIDQVKSIGIAISCTENGTNINNTLTTTTNLQQLPTILESVNGTNHLNALCSILSISKLYAIQLTFATIRSTLLSAAALSTEQLQQLIGTRLFFDRVVEYYYEQRYARLSLLCELLRIEQQQEQQASTDESATTYNSNVISSIISSLDIIDKRIQINGKDRGMFQLLLTKVCQGEQSLTWDQMIPAQKLSHYISGTNTTGSTDSIEWKTYMRDCIYKKRLYYQREKIEAMESLLLLLYNRLVDGVTRTDLALIVIAFNEQEYFTTTSTSTGGTNLVSSFNQSLNVINNDPSHYHHRLPMLAGLILIESMSLCRISINHNSNKNANKIPSFVDTHPLFNSATNNIVQVEAEIHTLSSLINRTCTTGGGSSTVSVLQKGVTTHIPESLALLSFGILLYSAGQVTNEWIELSTIGVEFATRANNEYDPFGYLRLSLDQLFVPTIASESSIVTIDDLPHDLQDSYSVLLQQVAIVNTNKNELSSPSLAYASIGRELLVAMINAYQSILLPTQQIPIRENIKLLSSIGACIFRNSPTLCESFWSEWDAFEQSSMLTKKNNTNDAGDVSTPLCLLLLGAHRLVDHEILSSNNDNGIIESIAPYLQFASSVAYQSNHVEEILSTMPDGLLGFTVHILASKSSLISKQSSSDNIDYFDCRDSIISSIAALARVGESDVCRIALRQSLNRNDNPMSGMTNLMQLALVQKSTDTITNQNVAHIFNIACHLLHGASTEWVLNLILCIHNLQSNRDAWKRLFTMDNSTIEAIVRLMTVIATKVDKIIFNSKCTDEMSLHVISVIYCTTQASITYLVSTLSKNLLLSSRKSLSYACVSVMVDFLRRTIIHLDLITNVHSSKLVKDASQEVCDSIISYLAGGSGLGEVVFTYALAPVSLILAKRVELFSRNTTAMPTELDIFPILHSSSSGLNLQIVPKACQQMLANVQPEDFDLDQLRSFDWLTGTDSCHSCLRASLNAIRLLNCWSTIIDEAISEDGASTARIKELLRLSPNTFLATAVTLPSELYVDKTTAQICSQIKIAKCALLPIFLSNGQDTSDEINLDSLLTIEVSDFLSGCLQRGKKQLITKTDISDDVIFRCLYRSKTIGNILRRRMVSEKYPDDEEGFPKAIRLRTCKLFTSYFNANPSVSSKVLELNDGVLIKMLVEHVEKSSTVLVSTLDNEDPTLSLRNVLACIEPLIMLWEYYRRAGDSVSSSWKCFTVDNSKVFSCIFKFVFDNGSALQKALNTTPALLKVRCLLLEVFSTTLNFVSREISWTIANNKIDPDSPLVNAMKNIFSHSKFIETARCFCEMQVFESLSDFIKNSNESVKSIDNEEILRNLDAYALSKLPGDLSAKDTEAIAHLVWQRSPGVELTHSVALVSNLAIIRYQSIMELQCLVSWKGYARLLSELKQKLVDKNMDNSVLADFGDVNLINQILLAAKTNLLRAKGVASLRPNLMMEQACACTKEIVGLVIIFHRNLACPMRGFDWNNTIALLFEVSDLVSTFMAIGDVSFYQVFHRIFAAAAAFIHIYPNGSRNEGSKMENSASLTGLASHACSVLMGMRSASVSDSNFMGCYCACISFLTCVVELMVFQINQASALDNLFQFFKGRDVLQLVIQNSKELMKATTKSNLNHWLLSISLLLSLAKSGTVAALRLLDSCDAFQMLWIETPDEANEDDSQKNSLVTLPKYLHLKLNFLAEWLRAANSLVESHNGFSELSQKLTGPSLNFVHYYRHRLMKSLTNVDETLISSECLTNANAFLAILVELCRSGGIYILTRQSPDLCTAIHAALLSILSSLGIYLGASAAAREIFRQIDQVGVTDDFDPFSPFRSQTSDQALFKGGLQNTRHEAVRYSHFVSKLSGSIFPKSFNKDFSGESSPGSNSMTALESACRLIVCQDFETLEAKAAECLFLTLQFLWKTHPASKSFVVVSDVEASQLDSMRFVNPGTVIAFRSINSDLQYGRVVRSDTLSRKWLVSLDESGREAIVHARQLAGVENMTTRRSVLLYLPAPDSASDIERFGPNASLGHLILILRWCNQFQQELGNSSSPSTVNPMTSTVCCLAALASSFLGTEVSLRVDNNHGTIPNQFADGVLATQVSHLFSKDGIDSLLQRKITENTHNSVGLDQFIPNTVSMAVLNLVSEFTGIA